MKRIWILAAGMLAWLATSALTFNIGKADGAFGLQNALLKITGQTTGMAWRPEGLNTPETTVEILIAPDAPAQTITGNIGTLFCNLSVKGMDPDRPAVILFPEKAAAYTQRKTDSMISIMGQSARQTVRVNFENLSLMPVGYDGVGEFRSSAETDFTGCLYLIKIYFAKGVKFSNVSSRAENGFLSNIDLRGCSDINITDCYFSNTNGLRGQREGCILQVRGNVDGLRVRNCRFEKYGNDEIIGVFGNPVPEPGLESRLTAEERNLITRRNIDISGNRFIYKRPEKLGRSLAGDERPVMDVMLSFVAYNPDVDPKSAPQTSWENVSVSGNEVICSAPVKRVLKVSSLDYCSKVKNFAITDNRISHDYRYVDFAADSDMFIFDFVVSASKVPSLEQEVRLSGNRIEAAETLPLNFWGHCAFMLEGASALLSGNEVDASHFRLQGKPTWHPASVVPVRAAYQPFSVTATGNRFVATAWPLYASEISGTGSGAVSRAVFTDNRVTGQSAMKFDRVGQVNLQVLSNEFTTSSLPLLTSGTPAGGSFNFTGNRYDYTGSAHDPELKGCDGSTGTLDRLIWRGNTVLAASAIKGITLPPAATLTDRSNRYRPTH